MEGGRREKECGPGCKCLKKITLFPSHSSPGPVGGFSAQEVVQDSFLHLVSHCPLTHCLHGLCPGSRGEERVGEQRISHPHSPESHGHTAAKEAGRRSLRSGSCGFLSAERGRAGEQESRVAAFPALSAKAQRDFEKQEIPAHLPILKSEVQISSDPFSL